MYYKIHGQLERLPDADAAVTCRFAAVLHPQEWNMQKTLLGFPAYAGLIPADAHGCKVEIYAHYIFGSIQIPDRKNLLAPPAEFFYYLNHQGIVLIDKTGQIQPILETILQRYQGQEICPEFFLYALFSEFLNGDMEFLENFENRLFSMEELALCRQNPDFIRQLLRFRRELMTLRCYYEQLQEMARELEGNSKNYFDPERLYYLHLFGSRTGQLLDMTRQSIEYCQTLRDVYQTGLDHRQNKNMRLLTILTSVFFPLTLITGWYGMNFHHMPELESSYGYPTVIVISLTVIFIELFLLVRRRK